MKKFLFVTVLFTFCLLSMKMNSQEVYKDYVDGQIYLKLKNEITIPFDTTTELVDHIRSLPFLNELIYKYNIVKVESPFYFSHSELLKRTFKIYFSKVNSIDAFIKELAVLNVVEYAEKVPLDKIDFVPDDLNQITNGMPLCHTLNFQYNLWGISAAQAWDITTGSPSVVIAIVDNEIQSNHPDLSPNIVHTRDVADQDNNTSPPASIPFNHGTHCAGIACAKNNNGIGFASIGYNCGLMAIKATSDTNSNGTISHGFTGITYAAQHGAKIISCSWGSVSYSMTGQMVIDNAISLGSMVIASAGNSNSSTPNYPAAYDHVISVANLNCANIKAPSSSFGSWVDISAYGENIYSTIPFDAYNTKSGTSMAAPMVAGLCGLIWSKFPYFTAQEVEAMLKQSAVNINTQNPNYLGQLGSGLINAYQSVYVPCLAGFNCGTGSWIQCKTESSSFLISGNTILPNYVVSLDAATEITLTTGFHAQEGCTFTAFIEGCGGSR